MISYWTNHGTIDLSALRPDDLTAPILGEVLARINRFNGRLPEPWPVAAHSVLVERLCPPDLGPWALLHDAHEAFIGDITSPAAELIGEIGGPAASRAIERTKGRLDHIIGAAWNTQVRSMNVHLRRADLLAASAEAFVFMGTAPQRLPWADSDIFDAAVCFLHAIPPGRDWRWACDIWLERIQHHARLGRLSPPVAQTTDPAETGVFDPNQGV